MIEFIPGGRRIDPSKQQAKQGTPGFNRYQFLHPFGGLKLGENDCYVPTPQEPTKEQVLENKVRSLEGRIAELARELTNARECVAIYIRRAEESEHRYNMLDQAVSRALGQYGRQGR